LRGTVYWSCASCARPEVAEHWRNWIFTARGSCWNEIKNPCGRGDGNLLDLGSSLDRAGGRRLPRATWKCGGSYRLTSDRCQRTAPLPSPPWLLSLSSNSTLRWLSPLCTADLSLHVLWTVPALPILLWLVAPRATPPGFDLGHLLALDRQMNRIGRRTIMCMILIAALVAASSLLGGR
jgi:hypothetical protein